MPFEGYQWGYERDLKLDPFVTQRGSGGQGRDLVEGARELLCGFDQRRGIGCRWIRPLRNRQASQQPSLRSSRRQDP
jgi:hypothetical protein